MPKSWLLSKADQCMGALERLFFLVIMLTIPFILLWTTLMLLLTPQALETSYGNPAVSLQVDRWSSEDRIALAWPMYQFLWSAHNPNDAADILREQIDPRTQKPLLRQPEIDHMIDVKELIDQLQRLGATVFALSSLSFIILWRRRSTYKPLRALRNGAVLTLITIATGGVFLSQMPWQKFFSGFHSVFFEKGTWVFASSSNLIQLFPPQFWKFNAALFVIILTAQSFILLFIALHYHRKREQRRNSASV